MLLKRMGMIGLLIIFTFTSLLTGVTTTKADYESDLLETGILVDADTGKILYGRNIDQPLPPASMVKMMSIYLIHESIEKGDISWDDIVYINDYLVNDLSKQINLSNVPLRKDEDYTVRELYESIAIYSANASMMAVAEHIAGSEGSFVEMMNEKGKELGMGNLLREEGEKHGISNLNEIAEANLGDFQFVNSTGLPNSVLLENRPSGTEIDDDNFMSARATATLAYHLLNDYPEVLETASIPEMTFKEGTEDAIVMPNWNKMLEGRGHFYEYADGLKTGTTTAAGACFTGTAVKNGRRLITVVMGLPRPLTSRPEDDLARYDETRKLMEYGFNNFSRVELYPENMTIEGFEEIPVVKGKEDVVSISTTDAVSAFVHRNDEESYQYSVVFNEDDELFDSEGRLIAPIEANTVIGQLVVEYVGDGEEEYLLGNGASARTVDIVTNEAVEKAGWFSLTMRGIGDFFSGLWNSIVNALGGGSE
ncbi:D-alanyl-D-alanine carboxypeptidase family protein [Evansella cellulosilytica]|uniref:serine-type D-Ala-D-Ala carboxypeptidase n=1 Tax=Evansella cellulosilytica (strain ATCC 21833 / DSM 2522 / FERM P-1141 / JCM 9156 / N-4) TaxID=649639 RepID=E6TRL0_EVAC2|nr:D-alanyl-D-alanine carboxypeptidase family protein [Evansella cellulosilytica]ADU28304.1 peptidase S11 D-alanyl-D-alanine carboxypeptidase 1 [Evansella cellulosilytica DSM 2522]